MSHLKLDFFKGTHGDGLLGYHCAPLFCNNLAIPFLLSTADGWCEFFMNVCSPAAKIQFAP